MQSGSDATARDKPMPCAQCGELLIAPTWSEPVGNRSLRHLWQCNVCGYGFETTVHLKTEELREPLRAA